MAAERQIDGMDEEDGSRDEELWLSCDDIGGDK
jgi:hypothetical protein